MNRTQIFFGLALIAVCCVTFTHSIRCFSCNSKKSCQKPKSIECNYKDANATVHYLDLYHKNVPKNEASPFIECFHEVIKPDNGGFWYKGCIYASIRACNLPLRESLVMNKPPSRDCRQCGHKNGCNPAGRADINLSTVLASAIIVALIAKWTRTN